MATVPLQNTPTEQLRVGSAPQLSATEVRPMDDVVTDDIERSSKAFKQFAQIAKSLQDERDDAHSKQLHTEYQTRALEIENDYLSTELGNAVKVVGYEDDGTTPITAYDQKVKDLNALKEEIAEKSENKNQLAIFNEKSSATLLSSTNRMSKHSIAEGSKHANNETIADINNSVTETGLSVDDFNMGENSEYVKNLIALDVKIKNYAESKGINFVGDSQGSTEDSETYINIRNGYLNQVHDASISKLLINNEYRKAKEYLEFHIGNGTIAEAQINKHMKTITTGLNKENGENIANNIIDGKNINSNDGNFTSSAQVITSLEGSNNATNSNGMPYVEGNTKEINILNLEKLQKESKYYKEGSTLSLPNEHRTTHLFLTKELGVKKADSIFSKAKKLLLEEGFVIDTEKLKNDPEGYGVEVNTKIMEKVVNLSKEELGKKYGEGDQLDLYSKDLDTVVSKIDYTYKDTQQPSMRIDELGVFNLEDALVFARENIKDKRVLEYVETNLKSTHKEREEFAETNYNEALEDAKEIAFAEEGGWSNIKAETFEKFTRKDKQILKNGHPEESNTDTYAKLLDDPTQTLPENLGKYRHLLSKSDYKKFLATGQTLSGGGSNGIIAVNGDVTMLKNTLNKYDMGDLYTSKNKNKKKRYIAIHEAWLNEINAQQITLKRKLTRGEKQKALDTVLIDNVNVDNDPFLGFIGGGDTKDENVFFVDQDRLQDVYVDVPYKGENVTVFISKIDPNEVLPAIKEALRKANKPVTQKNIADYWVRKGKPATLSEAFAYKEEE